MKATKISKASRPLKATRHMVPLPYHPSLAQCVGEEGGPGYLPNLLKEEEKEEDEERMKKDDHDEKEMKGKRRDEEDMQDSLMVEECMVVMFPLVSFPTCVLLMQLQTLRFFQQEEEVIQPHWIDTQRPTS